MLKLTRFPREHVQNVATRQTSPQSGPLISSAVINRGKAMKVVSHLAALFSALETIERDGDASQILYNKNGFVRLAKFGICQQTLKQDATNAMRKFSRKLLILCSGNAEDRSESACKLLKTRL